MKHIALFFSFLLHPLLMPTYGTAMLFYGVRGTVYDYITPAGDKWRLLVIIFLFSALLPAVNILLMFRLRKIPSIMLSDQRHRTVPYLLTSLFYFGLYYLLKDITPWPELNWFIIGAGFAVLITAIINTREKISAHMVGLGGLLGVFIALSYLIKFDMMWVLMVILLAAGIAGSSRLLLNEHRPSQIYSGFALGILVQLVIFFIGQGARMTQ